MSRRPDPAPAGPSAELALRAARLLAAERWPYLGAPLWSLRLREGHPRTMGVDPEYRLYFCAQWVQAQTQPALASVLVHECWHVLREHFARRGDRDVEAWNRACDAAINDTLPDLPEGAVRPEHFGMDAGMLEEQYYAKWQETQSEPERGSADAGRIGRDHSGGDQPAEAASADTETDQSPSAGSGQDADPSAGQGQGDASPQDSGDPGGTGGAAGQCPASPSSARQRSGDVRPVGGQDAEAGSQGSDCYPEMGGSGADGVRRPWEEVVPEAERLTPIQREMIRRTVAESVRAQGTEAGGWARSWAEGILAERPLPWQQILAGEIRRAVAWAAGQGDFTWMRPSRRGTGREYLLPAVRRPVPEVAVVVDTSGSVSDGQLAQARREVDAVLRATGARVVLISCDMEATSHGRRTGTRGLALTGGGGTSMGVGIAAAEALTPRPQVVITITDGYTDWPATPPRARHICVLTAPGEPPPWGKTVRVRENTQ